MKEPPRQRGRGSGLWVDAPRHRKRPNWPRLGALKLSDARAAAITHALHEIPGGALTVCVATHEGRALLQDRAPVVPPQVAASWLPIPWLERHPQADLHDRKLQNEMHQNSQASRSAPACTSPATAIPAAPGRGGSPCS